jgi:hypothetical protein
MVRGWNDPGSRISVRFADSSEQRELRVILVFHIKFLFTWSNLSQRTTAERTNDT